MAGQFICLPHQRIYFHTTSVTRVVRGLPGDSRLPGAVPMLCHANSPGNGEGVGKDGVGHWASGDTLHFRMALYNVVFQIALNLLRASDTSSFLKARVGINLGLSADGRGRELVCVRKDG